MHPVLKKFLLIVLGYAIFTVGTEVGARAKLAVDDWQFQRAVQALDAWKEKEKKDAYGGQTPEETLKMFTSALRAGDYDLAAKYLNSVSARERFEKMRDEGSLPKYAARLKHVRNDDLGYYSFINEKNKVVDSIVLHRNLNDLWKITDL